MGAWFTTIDGRALENTLHHHQLSVDILKREPASERGLVMLVVLGARALQVSHWRYILAWLGQAKIDHPEAQGQVPGHWLQPLPGSVLDFSSTSGKLGKKLAQELMRGRNPIGGPGRRRLRSEGIY